MRASRSGEGGWGAGGCVGPWRARQQQNLSGNGIRRSELSGLRRFSAAATSRSGWLGAGSGKDLDQAFRIGRRF